MHQDSSAFFFHFVDKSYRLENNEFRTSGTILCLVEVRLDVRSRVVLDGDRLIDELVGPVVRAVRTDIQQRRDAKSFEELELAGVRCRAEKQVIKNIHWRSLNSNARAV